MKTSAQQTASFRKSLYATKAHEAYLEARKANDLDLSHLHAWDADPEPAWEPIDLAQHAPTPSLGAWWEMEVAL